MSCEPANVLNQLENYVHKLQNARKPELYIHPAEYLYKLFHEFQVWNGLSNDITRLEKIESLIKTFRGGSYPAYLAEIEEKLKQENLRRIQREKEQHEIDLKKFFNYETTRIYHGEEDYLRISKDGEFIETSQDVRVPIKEARLLYKLIAAGKDIKGYKIGGYTVISLNGVLKIGCHNINKANMTEIGEKINE